VYTNEGEAISQLIAGYIDIILKKRAGNGAGDDEEQASIAEEVTTPNERLGIAVTRPIGGAVGLGGSPSRNIALSGGPQLISAETGNKQSFLHHVNAGFGIVKDSIVQLQEPAKLPPLGEDLAAIEWEKNTEACTSEMMAADVASNLAHLVGIIGQVCPKQEGINFTTLGSKVLFISTNLNHMSENAPLLAALSGNNAGNLLEDTRAYTGIFSEFFAAIQPTILRQLPEDKIRSIAHSIRDKSRDILIDLSEFRSKTNMEKLKQALKAVEESVDGFLENLVRNCGEETKEVQDLEGSIVSLKRHLEHTADVLQPGYDHNICTEALLDSSAMLQSMIIDASPMIDRKNSIPLAAINKKNMEQIDSAISRLISVAKGVSQDSQTLDSLFEEIIELNAQIVDANDDKNLLASLNKEMIHVVGQIVRGVQHKIKSCPAAEQPKMAEFCKMIETSGSNLSAAIREYSKQPSDMTRFSNLRSNMDSLEESCDQAIGGRSKKAIARLALIAHRTAVCLNNLSRAAKVASPYNRNQPSQVKLNQAAKLATEAINNVLYGLHPYMQQTDQSSAALGKIISSSKDLLPTANELLKASNSIIPTITDSCVQDNIQYLHTKGSDYLHELDTALELLQQAKGSSELDDLLDRVNEVEKLLNSGGGSAKSASSALEGTLAAISGMSNHALQIQKRQALKKDASEPARSFTEHLETFGGCVRFVAGTNQALLLNSAKTVVVAGKALLHGVLKGVKSGDSDLTSQLQQFRDSLEHVLTEIPGMNSYDKAIDQIDQTLKDIPDLESSDSNTATLKATQDSLKINASKLTVALTNLLTSKGAELGASVIDCANYYQAIVKSGKGCLFSLNDPTLVDKLKASLSQIGNLSKQLLLTQKKSFCDPSMKQKLDGLGKQLVDAVNSLLEEFSISNPVIGKCNKGKLTLESCIQKHTIVNDSAHSDMTYGAVVKKIGANTQRWIDLLSGIDVSTIGSKKQVIEGFVSDMCSMAIDNTHSLLRGAYLIGLGDSNSVPGKNAIVDLLAIEKAAASIRQASEVFTSDTLKKESVLESAAIVAKHTSSLCATCKQASDAIKDPQAKESFQKFAKNIANATIPFATAVKALTQNLSPTLKLECFSNLDPIVNITEDLIDYTSSKKFSGTPATISPMAKMAQQPLLQASKECLQNSIDMLDFIINLIGTPNDAGFHNLLTSQIQIVQDSLKRLNTVVASSAPGVKNFKDAISKITTLITKLTSLTNKINAGESIIKEDIDLEEMKERAVNDLRTLASQGEVLCSKDNKDAGDASQVSLQLSLSFVSVSFHIL
jgi:talin